MHFFTPETLKSSLQDQQGHCATREVPHHHSTPNPAEPTGLSA